MRRPKTGGRQKGTPNKATAEIREIAREYVPAAVAEAARLAVEATSEQARVAAIGIILDRAYGKAPQSLAVDVTPGGSLADLMRELDGRTRGIPNEGKAARRPM